MGRVNRGAVVGVVGATAVCSKVGAAIAVCSKVGAAIAVCSKVGATAAAAVVGAKVGSSVDASAVWSKVGAPAAVGSRVGAKIGSRGSAAGVLGVAVKVEGSIVAVASLSPTEGADVGGLVAAEFSAAATAAAVRSVGATGGDDARAGSSGAAPVDNLI